MCVLQQLQHQQQAVAPTCQHQQKCYCSSPHLDRLQRTTNSYFYAFKLPGIKR
jgi:hypothetical protein